MRRRARTLKEVFSKKVGEEKHRRHRPDTECFVDRNGSNPGEFLVWFGSKHYLRVNAIDLHDTVVFTDDRPGF